MKPRLRLVTPATVNRTVSPRRPKNGDVRTREHLTEDEVEKVIEAARNNRHGHRDALMVLLTYRHGLRAAEVVDLRWEQVDVAKHVGMSLDPEFPASRRPFDHTGETRG